MQLYKIALHFLHGRHGNLKLVSLIRIFIGLKVLHNKTRQLLTDSCLRIWNDGYFLLITPINIHIRECSNDNYWLPGPHAMTDNTLLISDLPPDQQKPL